MKRKRFFAVVAGAIGALTAGAFATRELAARGASTAASQGMMGGMMGSGGMMGHASTADMRTYMDMFMHHSQIRRTVEHVRGGVRTVTESDDPRLAAQIQAHVTDMYTHVAARQEVRCMSPNLPTMFREAGSYERRLQMTPKGVSVIETSHDPHLIAVIRAHADEVSGFVKEGMPAMMREMMQ